MHLERLACILEIVGQKGEATVAEICAHSDLPKPSAYRLVQDLVSVGLLEPVGRGQFMIGTPPKANDAKRSFRRCPIGIDRASAETGRHTVWNCVFLVAAARKVRGDYSC